MMTSFGFSKATLGLNLHKMGEMDNYVHKYNRINNHKQNMNTRRLYGIQQFFLINNTVREKRVSKHVQVIEEYSELYSRELWIELYASSVLRN